MNGREALKGLIFFCFTLHFLQLILTPGKNESGGLRWCDDQLQTRGSWSASRHRWLRSAARCLMWRVKWWRPGGLESQGLAHQGASVWRRCPLTTLTQSCQLVVSPASWTCWGEQLRLGPGPAALVRTATLLMLLYSYSVPVLHSEVNVDWKLVVMSWIFTIQS